MNDSAIKSRTPSYRAPIAVTAAVRDRAIKDSVRCRITIEARLSETGMVPSVKFCSVALSPRLDSFSR